MLDLSSFGLPLRRLSHLLFFFCMMFFMAPVAFAKNIDLLDSSSSEPLPQRLTPLWWNQISELNNQELVKKSELFKHELSRIQLAGESFELRSQVVVLLNKYINERNAPLRLAVTEEPLKKRYNLSDIGLMIKNNEVLDSDIKLLQVIHNEELEKIKNYNEQLSVIKLLYFKKDTRGLTKLVSGLRWIKTQLKVAILKINEERIKTEIKGKLNVFNSFQNRKEFALSHFVIEPQQLIDAEKKQSLLPDQIRQAKQHLEALENKQDFSIKRENDVAIDRQLLQLQTLNARAQLKHLLVWQMQSQLVLDVRQIYRDPLGSDMTLLAEHLSQGQSTYKNEFNWYNSVSDRVDRERDVIENGLKTIENDDQQKEKIKKRIIEFEAISNIGAKLESKLHNLRLLTTILNVQIIKQSEGIDIAYLKTSKALKSSWSAMTNWMTTSLFSINGIPVTPAGIFNFLVIILLGWLLSKLTVYFIKKVNNARAGEGMRSTSIKTLSRIISFIFLSIALLIGFSSLGIDVTKLTLFASALSIGIGFGLQNIINNFVSGVILNFERSMKVGDYIELASGVRGEVQEINIRSTVINTNDEIDVIVPNSEFVNSNVTNWTMRNKYLRLKVPFSVSYHSDVVEVRSVITKAVLDLPFTLNETDEQYPQVRLANFAESALDFEIVVWIKPEWVKRLGRVKSGYNWEIKKVLAENHIEIPFPQREVRIIKDS